MRAIEGRVVQKADCMPEGGSKYMQLKMSQIVLATKPSRTAEQLPSAVKNVYKPVANVREEVRMTCFPIFTIFRLNVEAVYVVCFIHSPS